MSNLLTDEQLENFKKLLENYQPNEAVLEQFKDSNFAVIAGPAGAGKDTLRNALLKQEPDVYAAVLSTTTRPARPGEQEGVDYYFRSPEEVEAGILSQEFLQVQLVHNQQISCMHVDEVLKLGQDKIGLSILIVQTEEKLRNIKPDIKTIFLIPPSLDILRERMQAERVLNSDEIDRRMSAAKIELETALARSDYYCLISGELDGLIENADLFLRYGQKEEQLDREARTTIQTILNTLSI
jgi:guanylate kinase